MKTKLFLILVTILIASCASMKPYNPTIEVYGNDKNSYALTNQYSASWAQIEETMLNICKSKNMDGWATHEGTKPIGVIRVY